ncbi:MAG TPA: hypothetical protein EYG68_08645 [Leucothrix mucor]|nr:hypothetical protein [Leucothrix mucor]
MSRLVAWLIGSVLVIAFVLGMYSLYQRLEIIESTTTISLEGEARKNPLYAARIFLHRMGIPASEKQSVQGLDRLPDIDSVLIISSKRKTLSRKKTDELYAWVREGGHLIARSTQDFDYSEYLDESSDEYLSDDPLQALLNVETGERIYLKSKDALIDIKGSERPLNIEVKYFYPIKSIDDSTAQDEIVEIKNNIFILRRQVGEGMITLVADLNFINNRQIRKADHAEILWQLVEGLAPPKEVWLIHNDEAPALWQLMWRTAWAFILSLSLLFILWLYRSSHRFGPLIPKAAEDRRSLIEHIAASGNFYWKHKQKYKLIESTRDALNRRIALTHPGWQQLSAAEKIEQLSTRLELSHSTIHHLLFDQKVASQKTSADEFTALVKQLEEIRNSL